MTGHELYMWRHNLHLTQRQAATALGISMEQYGDYERGHRRNEDKRAVAIPRAIALACAALGMQQEQSK